MSSIARKLKRQQDSEAKAVNELPEEQKRLPSARLLTTPVRGKFQSIPLLGWIARQKDGVPAVNLVVALLDDKFQIKGTLQIDLPIYRETQAATVAALARYGWEGQVWRDGDEHWPTGDAVNEDQLSTLIAQTEGLQASMTFPPDGDGAVPMQEVEVMRARGPFLMPPLPEPEEGDVDEDLITKFIGLCEDFRVFFHDDKLTPENKAN